MDKKKIIFLILAFLTLCLIFNFSDLLTLENAKNQQVQLNHYIKNNLLVASILYFILYVVATALSVPGGIILTMTGAALFGFWWAILLVSFASSIGATLAFLFSRYLLKDWVQAKFGRKLHRLNQGIEKDGPLYLFSLRLVPIFPFFMTNLLMGLTPISTKKYYLISQIGMLPTTLIYLNAGTQLAAIQSLSDILSPALLWSLAVLGLFPFVSKFVISAIKQKSFSKGHRKAVSLHKI